MHGRRLGFFDSIFPDMFMIIKRNESMYLSFMFHIAPVLFVACSLGLLDLLLSAELLDDDWWGAKGDLAFLCHSLYTHLPFFLLYTTL